MKYKSLVVAFICLSLRADTSVTPTYVVRSQSFNRLLQLVGTIGWGHTDLSDMDHFYGSTSALVGYSQSFSNNEIAHCLFGDSITCDTLGNNKIIVQGSNVADRNNCAWLADNFYLNCDYNGSFSFEPSISNLLVDFGFYAGLDAWVQGMYFRLFLPVARTKWSINFCVSDPDPVLTTSCAIGYMTPSGNETLLPSLADYFAGKAPASIDDVCFIPLKVAKMPGCDNTQRGFAEVRLEWGWNFINNEDGHVGVYAQMAAPTGNKRSAEYVFAPMVGNGHHWEAGGGISGHALLIESADQENHVNWYFDCLVTHIFGATEERTFDLSAKPNSRYMLALNMDSDVLYGLAGSNLPDTSEAIWADVTPPDAQFALVYNPVANLTTSFVNISSAAQIDFVTFLDIELGNFSFDIGYNLWARTCENISLDAGPACRDDRVTLFSEGQDDRWALKGDAHVFGYMSADGCTLDAGTAIPLSATQDSATIHSGTNICVDADDPILRNLGVDSARYAYADGNVRLLYAPGIANNEEHHIKTSINPQFINFENIDFQPTQGLSQTVFAHLSYTWERGGLIPYLGIGGSAEFGSNKESNIVPTLGETTLANPSNACIRCSLSQWTVWIKGGVSF